MGFSFSSSNFFLRFRFLGFFLPLPRLFKHVLEIDELYVLFIVENVVRLQFVFDFAVTGAFLLLLGHFRQNLIVSPLSYPIFYYLLSKLFVCKLQYSPSNIGNLFVQPLTVKGALRLLQFLLTMIINTSIQ